jgi:high-affinity iron transporter
MGQFLKALFGYNGNPSLIEALSYVAYFAAIILGTRSRDERRAASVACA